MRADLMSLTLDDLIVLSNRGTVKRVQREIEAHEFSVTITETPEGTVTFVWSDEVTCTLTPQTPLAGGQCTCPALGLCRHLLRSVLAYQAWVHTEQPNATLQEVIPWNPGLISDTILEEIYRKPLLKRLRQQFDDGHVIELLRTGKPTARFYTLPFTVRFLVREDVHYTTCNCAEPAPCSHVPLAVWGFRLLDEAQMGGIVETGRHKQVIPEDTLHEIHQFLHDLAELGLTGINSTLLSRLKHLSQRCREQVLLWHADILDEMSAEYAYYTAHDARFDPTHFATLIGELLIRSRGVRSQSVPAAFVRGIPADKAAESGTGHLVGIGSEASFQPKGVLLSAYVQDADSGSVLAVQRYHADTETALHQLANRIILKDASLSSLSHRQLLVKGGKRTSSGVFQPGRASINLNPQLFQWETLRAPVLAEDFTEIRERLRTQPPISLRPRRLGENIYVCPVANVTNAHFDVPQQAVLAVLHDTAGQEALLWMPFVSQAAAGVENLLFHLTNYPNQLRFVAGRVSLRGAMLISPLALIFEIDGQRRMVQPWLDDCTQVARHEPVAPRKLPFLSPQEQFPKMVLQALGELWLTGFQRLDQRAIMSWQQLVHQGSAMGFVRLLHPIQQLVNQMMLKQHVMKWDWRQAVDLALEVHVLMRFAQEEIG